VRARQVFQPCAADFARAEGDAAAVAPPPPAASSGAGGSGASGDLTQAQKDRAVLEQRLKANETARAERRAAEMAAARAVRGAAAISGQISS
jgi:hypothetical protein